MVDGAGAIYTGPLQCYEEVVLVSGRVAKTGQMPQTPPILGMSVAAWVTDWGALVYFMPRERYDSLLTQPPPGRLPAPRTGPEALLYNH